MHFARRFIAMLSNAGRSLDSRLRGPVAGERASRKCALQPATLIFQCNVCASGCAIPVSALQREEGQCAGCGASMRFRAVIHHLSVGLFGESLPIRHFPPRGAALSGIGMTDPDQYAGALAGKLGYVNTFLHDRPKLDIQAPAPEHLGVHDFVISSDVFEHVNPPISRAFGNLRALLRPGGLLVFTVPFVTVGETVEHFPELHDYTIEDRDGSFVLVNRTVDGRMQEYSDLRFHEGPGQTLEMRLFSQRGLERELESAGFSRISFHRESCLERGIYWDSPFSVPVTAIAA